MNRGKLLKSNQECPDCGSSDALAVYTNGTYCFNSECNTFTSNKTEGNIVTMSKKKDITKSAPVKFKYRPLPDRKIKEETCKKYQVTVTSDNKIQFPYSNKKGEIVAIKQKWRENNKKKYVIKDYKDRDKRDRSLFGQNLWSPNEKTFCIITEGEEDALAAYQMLGGKYPVLSVPDGCDSALSSIQKNWDYLQGFKHVVLCFDNDGPGKNTARKVADTMPIGQVKVANLTEFKDANEYLKNNEPQKFMTTIWNSRIPVRDDILPISDMWDRIEKRKKITSYPYPWEGLNKKIYGMRKGEWSIITARPKVGKSSIIREIVYNLIRDKDVKVGCVFLEESAEMTTLGLMNLAGGKLFHLPDTEYSKEEYAEAYKTISKRDNLYFVNSSSLWGTGTVEGARRAIEYMVVSLGCEYIFLDNLTYFDKDPKYADERRAIEAASSMCQKICSELDFHLTVVAHVNREGTIKGSTEPEQKAHSVIRLERNKEADNELERNTTLVKVTENRFSGRTGPACRLQYDEKTVRMEEAPLEDESEDKKEEFKGDSSIFDKTKFGEKYEGKEF